MHSLVPRVEAHDKDAIGQTDGLLGIVHQELLRLAGRLFAAARCVSKFIVILPTSFMALPVGNAPHQATELAQKIKPSDGRWRSVISAQRREAHSLAPPSYQRVAHGRNCPGSRLHAQ